MKYVCLELLMNRKRKNIFEPTSCQNELATRQITTSDVYKLPIVILITPKNIPLNSLNSTVKILYNKTIIIKA